MKHDMHSDNVNLYNLIANRIKTSEAKIMHPFLRNILLQSCINNIFSLLALSNLFISFAVRTSSSCSLACE